MIKQFGIKEKEYDSIVIGGGAAGLTVALKVAESGLKVLLLERDMYLGGMALTYCCQATDRCLKCGACLLTKLNRNVLEQPMIELKTQALIEKCVRTIDGYRVTYKRNQGGVVSLVDSEIEEIVLTRCIVYATGFEQFNLPEKKIYNYGYAANVISASDLSKQLKQKMIYRPSDLSIPKSIAFVHCVGSRSRKYQVNCSRVCCGYIARIALLIKKYDPDIEITQFFIDLQPFGRDSKIIYEELLESGVQQIRSIPAEAEELKNGDVKLMFEDRENKRMNSLNYSMVVLATGVIGASINRSALKSLLIKIDKDGFIRKKNVSDIIFITGTALRPMDISEAICHGNSTAMKVISMLYKHSTFL